MEGSLVNLGQLPSKTKTIPTPVVELQCADNAVAWPHLERELQTIVNVFPEAFEAMGPTISISKNKVLYQHNSDIPCILPTISIHRKLLENVDRFPYLASQGKH